MPNQIIRAIRDEDVESVVTLWHSAGLTRPWNDPRKDIEFARKGQHSTVLVMTRQGAIAATAMVGEDGHRGWVYYVATDPRRQRTGLGKAMMSAAEDWLAKRGIWKVQLMVRGNNADVHEFYRRLGYEPSDVLVFQKRLDQTTT
jgi:ribosomal protein S18 acetylase RimI-like enzyme